MKKLLLLFLVVFLTSTTQQTHVYICDSKGGKKYHYKENCRGLNACKHKITKLTISQAKNRGKTLCGWED